MHSFIKTVLTRSGGVFVLLKTVETPKGFFSKRKSKKALRNVVVKAVKTENGLSFFSLDIPREMSCNDWKTVNEKCGKYASRIVAPRSLSIPDYGALKRFLPLTMPSVLVFNSALKVISEAGADPHKISITLTDRNALHPDRLHALLPYSSSIKVVTTHPERYARACENAMNEHGASVILRSSYGPCEGKEIVICSDSVCVPSMQNTAVFGYKSINTGKLSFCGNGICLSESHRDIVPPETDPVDFAGAVTELCASTEYKKSVFTDIICSCNACAKVSPADCLRCFSVTKL